MFMRKKKKATVKYQGQTFILELWIRFWLKCRYWEDNCGEFSEIIIVQLKKKKTENLRYLENLYTPIHWSPYYFCIQSSPFWVS